jgi:hypothetical protein
LTVEKMSERGVYLGDQRQLFLAKVVDTITWVTDKARVCPAVAGEDAASTYFGDHSIPLAARIKVTMTGISREGVVATTESRAEIQEGHRRATRSTSSCFISRALLPIPN